MSIGRICQRNVDLADADESVRFVAERMHQRSVGSLVVLDEWKRPIGIITDRDIVIRVIAAGKDPDMTQVCEAMTASPRTVTENTSIEQAIRLMRSGVFRRLPVVDRDGKLVGLVAADDILCPLAEEFADVGRLLERETPQEVASLGAP